MKQKINNVVERHLIGTDFIMYKFNPPSESKDVIRRQPLRNVKHTFVLDNSSSMSHYSRDAPQPLDEVLSNETSIDSIGESCQNHATFDSDVFLLEFEESFEIKMNRLLRPYFIAFQFALFMRKNWSKKTGR